MISICNKFSVINVYTYRNNLMSPEFDHYSNLNPPQDIEYRDVI